MSMRPPVSYYFLPLTERTRLCSRLCPMLPLYHAIRIRINRQSKVRGTVFNFSGSAVLCMGHSLRLFVTVSGSSVATSVCYMLACVETNCVRTDQAWRGMNRSTESSGLRLSYAYRYRHACHLPLPHLV